MAGSVRSFGVIERMMASTWPIWRSSTADDACLRSLGTPGRCESMPETEPIFLTCWSCSRKSSSVNRPEMMAAAPLVATSLSMVRSACSMRLSTSPMPRMRSAMRSGWNRSKSSSFSPVEAKAMGRPTTSLTDRAAPPLASPSSLVRMTPSRARVSWKARRRGHRVLAGHGVDHEERVVRVDHGGDVADLLHEGLVDGQPSGGVDDEDVAPEPLGLAPARRWPRPPGRSAR